MSSPTHETHAFSTEHLKNARRIHEQATEQLDQTARLMHPLLELRHQLFDVENSEFSKEARIASQLYDLPGYNESFIGHDMGVREGNVRDYHDTTESYEDDPSSADRTERNRTYRREIMRVAQELGFIAKEPGVASEKIDRDMNILDSTLEPIPERVAAIVINGAAGMSNIMRVRDAVRNIESGAIKTERIIVSAGERPVNDAEKGRVIAPYRAGDTEFESIKLAVEDLTGASFESVPTEMAVPYGTDLTARHQSAEVTIGNHLVTIDIIEAPFDRERTMDDGSPARRINTEEAFKATLPLLESLPGAIVMQSHDTWTPWQAVMAQMLYGLEDDRQVYAAGPLKADRVYWTEENGEQVMDIKAAQDVVDELMKTYRQLTRLQAAAAAAAQIH